MKSQTVFPFLALQVLVLFGQHSLVADGGPFERFGKAIDEYEAQIFGKRTIYESNGQEDTIEISSDGRNLRSVHYQEIGEQHYFDFTGHYVSCSLGQVVSASKTDPRRSKEAIQTESFGVTFFKGDSALLSVKDVFEGWQYCVFRGKRLSTFFKESKCSQLPEQDKKSGALCSHPSGAKLEVWIDNSERLAMFRWEFKPGDLLDNGERVPKGQWSKFETTFKWELEPKPLLVGHTNSMSGNGGRVGSRAYKVIESIDLEEPLSSLIDLEILGLKNGVAVTCSEQPNKLFRFHDGRVVAEQR